MTRVCNNDILNHVIDIFITNNNIQNVLEYKYIYIYIYIYIYLRNSRLYYNVHKVRSMHKKDTILKLYINMQT